MRLVCFRSVSGCRSGTLCLPVLGRCSPPTSASPRSATPRHRSPSSSTPRSTCPHCAAFHSKTLPELKKRYIDTGKVRLVLRDFPLDQIALKAAVIAHCAGPERATQVRRRLLRAAGELGPRQGSGAGAQAAGPAGRAGRRSEPRPASPTSRWRTPCCRPGSTGSRSSTFPRRLPSSSAARSYPGDSVDRAVRGADRPAARPVGLQHRQCKLLRKVAIAATYSVAALEITRLRVSGFKSFSDPVELQLESGLTGIVGPNGCGKSNIVEALRWAMGEGSAKGLRGDGMDDVIFNGSASSPGPRRGRGPPQAARAARGPRRLRRGAARSRSRGGSAAAAARSTASTAARSARATSSSCSPTPGAGSRSPAIIGQGQIGFIVDSRPVDRRRLLEEAAGHRRPAGAPTRGRAAAGSDPGQPAARARPAGYARKPVWPS